MAQFAVNEIDFVLANGVSQLSLLSFKIVSYRIIIFQLIIYLIYAVLA